MTGIIIYHFSVMCFANLLPRATSVNVGGNPHGSGMTEQSHPDWSPAKNGPKFPRDSFNLKNGHILFDKYSQVQRFTHLRESLLQLCN